MITRRKFIKFMIVFINSLMIPMISRAVEEKGSGKIDISKFNIFVPSWLLDKNRKQKDRTKALSVQKNKTTDKLIIIFSGNKKLSLNHNTSVDSLIKNNKNKATRESMLLKRTIAYALAAIYNQNKNKSKIFIKKDFESFQTEEVIMFITLGALYNLIIDFDKSKAVSSIKWDHKSHIFKVK